MVGTGAVIVVWCIHRNAACIKLLGKQCIQIEEVGKWRGGVSGLVGSGVAIVEGFWCCSIMANQLAALGVL